MVKKSDKEIDKAMYILIYSETMALLQKVPYHPLCPPGLSSGSTGGVGGPGAAAVEVVAAMDDDWRQKRPATRALTVA